MEPEAEAHVGVGAFLGWGSSFFVADAAGGIVASVPPEGRREQVSPAQAAASGGDHVAADVKGEAGSGGLVPGKVVGAESLGDFPKELACYWR